jgi:LL-diaminopimelate aminotransferase
MKVFREAVTHWYRKRYGVEVDPGDEVLALIGSKEGVHHFVLARVNPGDIVLMTDPGYPAYRASILMAGGEPYSVPIHGEDGYLPCLSEIPEDVAKRAVAFFLNYPNNPTGATATRVFFEELIEFAHAYDIAICHDNPYSEILFDGAERLSFLAISGAKEVGIELNSLSKPFNMTGWRIGMALGNRDLIRGLSKVKENTDSGIFAAVQYAGIQALTSEESNIERMLEIYRRRRDLVVRTFNDLGWNYTPQKGTFYLWLPTPGDVSSLDFTNLLFDRASVVVAAGSAYGRYGEGYIRISLTVNDDRLDEAMERIKRALAG